MDKKRDFFVINIWRYFQKESLCICYFSIVYFVCENIRDLEQWMPLTLN